MPDQKSPASTASKPGGKPVKPPPAAGRKAAETARKKNLRLHQSKIDAARKILGTKSETETIETALDLIVFRQELTAGIEALEGAPFVDVFGGE